MHWNRDHEMLILVLVPALEASWIILCDHVNMLRHLFWAFSGFVSCWALSLSCGHSTLGRPQLINSVAAAIRLGFCLVLVFSFEKQRLIRCNCGDKSFYSDPGPPFLISSTVSISPLESSSRTPLDSLHSYLQYEIACLHLLACVLRFVCRKSLLGEVNQVVLV